MRAIVVLPLLFALGACRPAAFVTSLESGGFNDYSIVWGLSDDGVATKLWDYSRGGLVSQHSACTKDGWLYLGLGNTLNRYKYDDPEPEQTEDTLVIVDWSLGPWRLFSPSVANGTLWYSWNNQRGNESHLEAMDLETRKVKWSILMTDADAGGRTPGVGIDGEHYIFASYEMRRLQMCSGSGYKSVKECPAVKIVGLPENHLVVDALDISYNEKSGKSVLLYMGEFADAWAALGRINVEHGTWEYDGVTPLLQVPLSMGTSQLGYSFPMGLGYDEATNTLWVEGFEEGVMKGKFGESIEILEEPKIAESWPIALTVNYL